MQEPSDSIRRLRRRSSAHRPGVAAMVAALAVVASGCAISWRAGVTHGAIIEVPAARASVGIWRAPTRALHSLYQANGIRLVQDVLCQQGRFPAVSLSVGDARITVDVIKARWCGYVYGDGEDLRGALEAAGRRDDCLALTLISRGAYLKNWTHKGVGCRNGSLR